MIHQHTHPAEAPARSSISNVVAQLDLRGALRRAYATNRALTLLGVLMLIALAACLGGLALDPRTITGAPAWLKPAKFAISIALYAFTLQWLLGFVEGRRFWVRLISFVTLLAFIVEFVAIAIQVLRGTISHFNFATPFDSVLFGMMGMFVMAIWVMNLIAAILLLFQRLPDPALAWSLRLALLITLVGAGLGFLMTQPTPTQMQALQNGAGSAVIGAHSVGVADGGPGLPVTGWSTVGGDLRIGHFVGLHALQMLPIVGWLLTRRRATRRLRVGQRTALVWIVALSYLALIGLLTWQALRGQPLLAPDTTTLAAAGAWLGATALAIAGVVSLGPQAESAA